MWYAAIKELKENGTLDGIDDIIGAWPELDVPHHSQTSLSTRDAWLKYQNLPNRRAFQFMTTLSPPVMSEKYSPPETMTEKEFLAKIENLDAPLNTEMQDAQKHSRYMPFTKPFELDLDNLYRRDTNELIKPYLDAGLELVTVAQRIKGYFAHGESKVRG